MLNEGINQDIVIQSLRSPELLQVINPCNYIPRVFLADIEESYVEELKQDPSIEGIYEQLPPIPAAEFLQDTKTFTTSNGSGLYDGRFLGPLTFYLFNNQINSNGSFIGQHPLDDSKSILGTYSTMWTGKDVDIVTLEVPITTSSNWQNHIDFKKRGDISVSRIVPENWQHDSLPYNQQINNTSFMTSHASGVLSVAGGSYAGHAKNSSLRVIYLDSSPVTSIDEVIRWHRAKPINSNTGLKNPTILIHEYQYMLSWGKAIKISSISQINWYNDAGQLETINRPAGGWGNDLTPFTNRNFNVRQVTAIVNGVIEYHWAVITSFGTSTPILAAINAATNEGIISCVAAGNDCGVYVKENNLNFTKSNWAGATLQVDTGANTFNLSRDYTYNTLVVDPPMDIGAYTASYALNPFGPHGSSTGIDVAAGQNSSKYPILDGYSARGPGIDIVGQGAYTFSAYPGTTDVNGYTWGLFSGTSSATPTVAGVLACLLEKYKYYTGKWPTPQQAKDLLITESNKDDVMDVTATTWSNAPTPATHIISGQLINTARVININSGMGMNGGILSNELKGTVNRRAFINCSLVRNAPNYTDRPASGTVYPRVKIRR